MPRESHRTKEWTWHTLRRWQLYAWFGLNFKDNLTLCIWCCVLRRLMTITYKFCFSQFILVSFHNAKKDSLINRYSKQPPSFLLEELGNIIVWWILNHVVKLKRKWVTVSNLLYTAVDCVPVLNQNSLQLIFKTPVSVVIYTDIIVFQNFSGIKISANYVVIFFCLK